jgi:putative endonuclease
MTTNRKALGASGEEAAAVYLTRIGFRIVGRNVRPFPGMSRGELDIVAWENGVLVFIEVKTRSKPLGSQGYAAESITYTKRKQLVTLANAYMGINRTGDVPCRFDVVFVVNQQDLPPRVQLVRNAFDASN